MRDILKGISLGSKNLNFCDASNHFHHLFFFGDLNYRLDDLDSVVSNCRELKFSALLLSGFSNVHSINPVTADSVKSLHFAVLV